jgi:hypothetical protein
MTVNNYTETYSFLLSPGQGCNMLFRGKSRWFDCLTLEFESQETRGVQVQASQDVKSALFRGIIAYGYRDNAFVERYADCSHLSMNTAFETSL